ncbi:MAG: FUSC family protein [Pseudomonadota bacterium]
MNPSPLWVRASDGLRAIFGGTFEWTDSGPLDPGAMAVTALGMGVPILIGVMIGRPTIGMAASVGGMWIGNAPRGISFGEHWRILRDIVVAAILAAIVSVAIAQHGMWTDLGLTLAAGGAALAGGFSRPMAAASQRFIVFVTIGVNVAAHTHDKPAVAILIGEGALWTALCALAIGLAARRFGIGATEPRETGSTAPFRAKLRRWRGTLKTLAGWNYATRLAACLALATTIREAFPQHHFGWIAVAVALLTQRQPEGLIVKVSQRALGVAAGVLATELVAAGPLPGWWLLLVIAGLAALSPYLRKRSYVAYTAATTPLILLLTSGGATIGQGLLLDRLVATLIAAALVIGAFLLIRRLAPPSPAQL